MVRRGWHRRGHRSILIISSGVVNRSTSATAAVRWVPAGAARAARRAQRLSRSRALRRSARASRSATGLPVAIEQDLAWCRGLPTAARSRLACRTRPPATAVEPTLEDYFFERIAPVIESALAEGPSPDLAAHHPEPRLQDQRARAPRGGVGAARQVQRWLTTAAKTATTDRGAAAARAAAGADRLARRPAADLSRCRARRRAPAPLWRDRTASFPPTDATPAACPALCRRTNYRRWWNHPWRVVEAEGQRRGRPNGRRPTRRACRRSCPDAHAHGLWIRFYTLNGLAGEHEGWTASYNFGSRDAAPLRWRAAIDANVDFIATDQYVEFARSRAK